jgi:hypothetical protein
MEFNISDRVRVKKYDDLPGEMKNKGIGRLCQKDGEIVDKLWSGAKGCTIYKILFDGSDKPSKVDFSSKSIDLVSEIEKKEYSFELEILNNVVVGKFIVADEEHKTEIARGHGHIIHEGAVGIAQAASYALKKIYQKITENKEKEGI